MDRADIVYAITGQNELLGSELDSTSVTWLLELGVIRGLARNESCAGSKTTLNQHRTGVSCRALTEIPRW